MRLVSFLLLNTVLGLLLIISCQKECPGPNQIFIDSTENSASAYHPLVIARGTTITWINKDEKIHTVTSDDLSFSSNDLNLADTFSYTFSSTGEYTYHSQHDSSIKGMIIVQ